jgi:hypothetical protein
MPLLAVEPKGKSHILRLELDGNTRERLNQYCAFANNAREDSVIRAALNHAFDEDKEFQTWSSIPENLSKIRPRARRRKSNNADATTSAKQ